MFFSKYNLLWWTKSRNGRITENDGLEMTISEKWWSEAVNNGQPLFKFENNGDEKTDR